MSKIERLKALLKSPIKVIKAGLLSTDEANHRVKCANDHNIESLPTVSILDFMTSGEITVSPYSFLHGTSLPTDLALLKLLAKRYDKCAYLEIGSWRGESIANVFEVTNDVTSLTLSEKEMHAFGFGQDFIDAHGFYVEGNDKIKHYKNNSLTFDFKSLHKKYDLIFIDGDHSYEGVLTDSKNVFQHLLKNDNSIIVWHDYGYDTESVRYPVLNAILDAIPKEKHQNLYHVSNTLCAIYSSKPLQINQKVKKYYPNKTFKIELSIKTN